MISIDIPLNIHLVWGVVKQRPERASTISFWPSQFPNRILEPLRLHTLRRTMEIPCRLCSYSIPCPMAKDQWIFFTRSCKQ